MSWDAPGAPGMSFPETWLISAKYFSPGVLTDQEETLYNRLKLRNSPKTLKISSGSRREAAGQDWQLELQEIERKRMDWLLGLLIPLKWAVVLVIIYFVLTAIL